MNEENGANWERQLAETAARFSYPPTPDLAGRLFPRAQRPQAEWGRRLAWVALALLLAAALLAVPGVRAAVLDWLQVGAVRLLPVEARVMPVPAQPAAGVEEMGARTAPLPMNTALPGRTLTDLAEATTWEAVRQEAGFGLRLPGYPPGLGLPDEVYQQQLADSGLSAPVVILIWRDFGQAQDGTLALYQMALPYYGLKAAAMAAVAETEVQGSPAFWVEGPHQLQLNVGEGEEWLPVAANVLVWMEGEVTYRLEGATGLAEAVRIAESLQPAPEAMPCRKCVKPNQ